MRILGIDYGEKRVGVAISDEGLRFALPNGVLPNKDLAEKILTLIKENSVNVVVIGESKNFKGEPNKIMANIEAFKKTLDDLLKLNKLSIKIEYHPEFMTSEAAALFQGEHEKLDAGAAALILQSYLDTLNYKKDKKMNEDKKEIQKDVNGVVSVKKEPVNTDVNKSAEPVVPAKISIDDFKKAEIHIGKIVTAEKIEGADKLLKLSVDFGALGTRQVVSGIALSFDPEMIIGKSAAFVTNLEFRKIRGLESQAMILAVNTESGIEGKNGMVLVGPTDGPHKMPAPGSKVG